MPRLAFAVSALCLVLLAPTAAPAAGPPDPLPLYGKEMVFSVWRSGSAIGQHRVTFTRDDAGMLMVRSLLELAVKILGITVYRYSYQSQETWRDGRLVQLASTIDDNGKPISVAATEANGKLAVTGPEGSTVIDGPILPSTHWNAQVVSADRVLNTLNGKLDGIRLVPQGSETVPTGDGPRAAAHYLWAGDIQAESWYDSESHWVKLRFPGKDGTAIEYVCMRCFAEAH